LCATETTRHVVTIVSHLTSTVMLTTKDVLAMDEEMLEKSNVYCSECAHYHSGAYNVSCRHPDNCTLEANWYSLSSVPIQCPSERNKNMDCATFERKE